MIRNVLTAALLFALPVAGGELIQTTGGDTYVGEVTNVTNEFVEIEVDYPEPGKARIPKSELTNRTIWRIRSDRLDRLDAAGWFDLARWAEDREMGAPAIVAYRKAARDPGFEKQAKARARKIKDSLAQDLFDRGESRWAKDQPASARHYFETLVKRYPDAPTAPVARTRLERIRVDLAARKHAEKKAEEAAERDKEVRKELARWNEDVERIRSLLRRAARYRPEQLQSSRPVKTSRALEDAVAVLKRAWNEVQDLGAPPETVKEGAGKQLRHTVKQRLVSAYVDTGYAYLMRPSLEQAEEYATEASELDPDSSAASELYRKIIAAREVSDFDDRFFSDDPSIARRLRR